MALRRPVRLAAMLVLLVPLAVTSTPPHMDWYLFQVSGHVVRPAGSLDNYTVVLMKYDNWWDRGGWTVIHECIEGSVGEYGPLVPVCLSDSNGAFTLNVAACDNYLDMSSDTLAVGVVLPDTLLLGTPFRVNSVRPTVIERTASEERSLCDDGEYTYVDGYIYKFPPRNITIP